MKLTALNPRWGCCMWDGGGAPTRYWLNFICPSCGPPFAVHVEFGPEKLDAPRTWQAAPLPPANVAIEIAHGDWLERLTLTPSINHTGSGHGPRHPTCGFHGHITDGQIIGGI